MIYSNYLKEFYSTYFMDKALLPGKYRLKFIVDSKYTCDGNYTIGEDKNGNYNNIIEISTDDAKQIKKEAKSENRVIKYEVF